MKLIPFLAALSLAVFTGCTSTPSRLAKATHTFVISTNDFLLDGQRLQIRCGEIHASRIPKEYWRQRLQMCKAMGLNAVCAYLFWNLHEPSPGEFNWSGDADVAEFCRIAQEEGLWVLLRPGPYSCAEWDMGGLPWWLLKDDDIKLRTRDPRFMEPAKRYLKEVARVFGPLQVTHGGPILMVQVENEYGFQGSDTNYMGDLRQAMVDNGIDVPLFACNPGSVIRNGQRADIFPVVNFGSDPAGGFRALRRVLPVGPLMCGEFYPGWFDSWGQPHHFGNTPRYLADLEYMLKTNASFSIYMAHGGTTFGFWQGANAPYSPQTSSYDYDAPISEAGWPTDKFFKTRELFRKYLLPGETIPEPSATNAVISISSVQAASVAMLLENLPKGILEKSPVNMEKLDQGFGCILYRTQIPAGPAALLEAESVHDIGQVFLNGKRIGFMDRRKNNFKVRLPERQETATLDILVDAMGRVNFGNEVRDRKGILGSVKLADAELTDWQTYSLPLNEKMLAGLRYKPATDTTPAAPGFWKASFNVETPGDTFLDVRPWGKGYAWINGHNLGRFWNIGPQQTMYIPGIWLKPGKNEIIILDLLGPEKPVFAALDRPILNELHPEKDFSRARRPVMKLHLDSAQPVQAGAFPAGSDSQEVKFGAAANGRFFCLEALNSVDGQPYAAISELDVLDANGKPISHDGWTVAYVDSEELNREDGSAENAIDGQTANFWHTEWGDKQPNFPHRLVIDLGKTQEIRGFRYVPRQGQGGGRIKDYKIFVGNDLVTK